MQVVEMNAITAIRNLINLGKMVFGSDGEYQFEIQTGEVISKIRFMQNFGFVSAPPIGSTSLLAARAGSKDASVAIVIENRAGAVSLAEGETVVYNNSGVTIHLKAGGEVEIKGADLVVAEGDVSDQGLVTPSMQDMRDLYNTHTHVVTGSVTAVPTQQM